MEFSLLAAVLTAAGCCVVAARLLEPPDGWSDLLLGGAGVGLIVGRLAAMMISGVNPISVDIIIIRSGVHTGLAATAAIGYVLWTTRLDTGILDRLAPIALAGLGGWHGGCVWRGPACLGTASNLPWAYAQTGSSLTRHPVEIYTAIGLLLMAWLVSKPSGAPGRATAMALAAAGGIRLITQPLRPSIGGGPIWWYATAVAIGLTLAWFPRLWPRARVT